MGQEKVIGKVYTDEELSKKAKEELNEDPKRIEKDMKAIREWIKKQPHLAKTSKQGQSVVILTLFCYLCTYYTYCSFNVFQL